MAIYLAKPPHIWTSSDLEAYDINLVFEDAQTFFGETLPAPSVHRDILTAPTADDATDDASYTLLAYLEIAMDPTEKEGSGALTDFDVALLRSLGYVCPPRGIRTGKVLQLHTCGESMKTTLDVCIIDRATTNIILVVKEDGSGSRDPYPQLIAEAIAVFQDIDCKRRMMGLDALACKIPITRELARCVQSGTLPCTPTIVTGHVPMIPRPILRLSEGMKPLDNRKVILQCFEAFKKFVV